MKATDVDEQMTEHSPEETFATLTARLEELSRRAQRADALKVEAETEAKVTKANAAVDRWLREGHITGNAAVHVRSIYVRVAQGHVIAPSEIEAMVAALPRLATKSIHQPSHQPQKNETETNK